MTESESQESERSPLAKALGNLFEVKLSETLENGFIKSIGTLQQILILFVLMGVFSSATCIGISIFVVSLTYLLTGSLQATAIAGVAVSIVTLTLTLLFFLKVLGQEFWFGIFNIKKPIVNSATTLPAPTTNSSI